MSNNLLLGVDIGTTGCKAGLYDSDGKAVAKASEHYDIETPRPKWVEQDPNVWWRACCRVIREVVQFSKCEAEDIIALSVSGQAPVLIPVSRSGRPLHKALLWMDRRAVDEANLLMKQCGLASDASFTLPKMLWFKRNRPQIYEKAFRFVQALDFITFKLTGKFLTDWYTASTAFFDIEKRSYPEDAASRAGLDLKLLPEAMPPGTIVGELRRRAAKLTGLSTRCKVVLGSIDAYLAVLGCGCVSPGMACDITGASTCIMVTYDRKETDLGDRCQVNRHIVDGLWIVSAIMATTGAALDWFKEILAYSKCRTGKLEGLDAYDLILQEASRAPAGSEGLVFLPYMLGERSPIWNPDARGVLFGLTLRHRREHLLRAVLEGCAFGVRHNVEVMREMGVRISEYRLCGGGAKSDLWNQIKADVLGMPVSKVEDEDASLLGAVILAAAALGVHESVRDAVKRMVRIEKRYEPDRQKHTICDRSFALYKELYPALKDLFAKL